jgi:hypothetical protein
LTLETTKWNSPDALNDTHFSYSPNYLDERLLKTGQVIQITLKLRIPLEIEISHFNFDIVFGFWTPDIDGNGDVDFRDLSKVAKAYPSEEGSLLYDGSYDLNFDGKISQIDIIFMRYFFGRTDF